MTEYVRNHGQYAERSQVYHEAENGKPKCRLRKTVRDSNWVKVHPDDLPDSVEKCQYCSGEFTPGEQVYNDMARKLDEMSVDEFDRLLEG